MDSLNHQSTLTPTKTKLSKTFAKVLHIQKTKSTQQVKPHIQQDEKLQNNNPTMDAFIAKLFATISSVKTAYAQLQVAQSPYNPESIQSADQIMVSELKTLSEYKQLFLKKHLEDEVNPPETTQLLAEIQEQKNLIQMYEINVKKLDSQKKLKDSEIIFLKEKLHETNKENKVIEMQVNLPSFKSFHQKISFSSLTTNSFLVSLHQTMRSVKSFMKFMMEEMEAANWDLNAAASSIHPHVVFPDHITSKFFAFESFVCRVMFEGFNDSGFSIKTDGFESGSRSPRMFFDSFKELKSLKAQEYIAWKADSIFARFCWLKYLKLVHPVMELSFFGNLNQRNLVSGGKFPETNFFGAFADMARRVWLLHCLANAFDSNAPSAFRVREGSRFTEVFMESVNEEPVIASPKVGFTVVPGFKVGGTVIQCQVYLI